ncbi:MAG: hypothetical protein WCB80_08920, partial [Mycobacterium sp.]
MSGPNPPGRESEEPDPAGVPSGESESISETGDDLDSGPDSGIPHEQEHEQEHGGELELLGAGGELEPSDHTGDTDIHSRAYSAPESEQFISGPYVPTDDRLYGYDGYVDPDDDDDDDSAPRWPWVVGVAAILAAIALVVSVSLLVTRTESNKLANPGTPTSPSTSTPPVQDEITPTTTPPP